MRSWKKRLNNSRPVMRREMKVLLHRPSLQRTTSGEMWHCKSKWLSSANVSLNLRRQHQRQLLSVDVPRNLQDHHPSFLLSSETKILTVQQGHIPPQSLHLGLQLTQKPIQTKPTNYSRTLTMKLSIPEQLQVHPLRCPDRLVSARPNLRSWKVRKDSV